jgi:predicted O-linked N-acetylglucosamine transferase (SPINDLY family)
MNDHSMIDPLEQAIKLQNSGAVNEAKLIFLRLLANDQKNIAALYSLAVLHFNKGEAEKALPYIDQAISLKPEIEYFYSTKKAILNLMGSYEAAYLLKVPGANSDQGRIAVESDLILERIKENPASLFINSGAVNSLSNLVAACETYTKNGQFEKVILLYRHYINSKAPDAFLAKYNLGALYSALNEHHFSAACYEELTTSYSGFIPAYMNLGTVYERLGRNKDAFAAWEKALALPQVDAPENKEEKIKFLNNLGRLNEIDRSYEKAEHYLYQSMKEDASQSAPLQHWFHLRQKQFKWPLLTDDEFCQRPIEEIMSPLASLAYTNDPALQRACAERFVKEKVKVRARRVPKHHRYNHDKIRIGYASSDLSTHAVSLLTVELFELHDREKFEVHAF